MKRIYRSSLLLIVLCISLELCAQEPKFVVSAFRDDLSQWEYWDVDEERIGTLELTWPYDRNWKEWRYRIGDDSGDIRQKWEDDPSLWELDGYDDQVTMRAQWKGDFSRWRITSNGGNYLFRSRYRNDINEWYLEDESHGVFAIYTSWQGDPRDWEIRDELDESISREVKLAMVFIAIYHSIPKN